MVKQFYLVGLFLFILSSNVLADKAYTFGVVPQQAASKLVKTWLPVFQYIESKTGIKIKFSTAKNIPAFEKACKAGAYDFAYMNPYHYITFNQSTDYQAIAKARGKRIKGIMVVKKDSKYKSLSDLDEKKIAFPSPKAFAASMLPRAALKENKITFTPMYVSSHDSVYRNVAAGIFVSGGGVKRTFKATAPETREKLKVLWVSKGFTPHAFAYLKRVPINDMKKIQHALIEMEKDVVGKSLLESLKLKGIVPAVDSDWNDVRKLNL